MVVVEKDVRDPEAKQKHAPSVILILPPMNVRSGSQCRSRAAVARRYARVTKRGEGEARRKAVIMSCYQSFRSV